MWWSRALIVLVLVALGPVGCGFRPLYGRTDGTETAASSDLAAIRVLGIENRAGQQLRNNLVQRLSPLGEPARPRYALDIKMSETLEGQAESSDGKATVGRMTLTCNYILSDIETGRVVKTGTARSLASMRYLGPRYASVAAERDTESRVLTDMAEEIRSGLAAWFVSHRAANPVNP
jgi:LPS-assembly lipoprotein